MESQCLSRKHVYSTNKELLPPPWRKNKYSNQCATRGLAPPAEEWSHQGGFSAEARILCVLSHAQLCDLMDCSSLFSSVHGIFWARILKQVVIFSSRGSSWLGMNPRLLHLLNWQADSFFFLRIYHLYILFFFFLTLQYCIGFAIYQHEPTNGVLLRWILYYWGIHQNSWLN